MDRARGLMIAVAACLMLAVLAAPASAAPVDTNPILGKPAPPIAPTDKPAHFRHDASWAKQRALRSRAGAAALKRAGKISATVTAPDLGLWVVRITGPRGVNSVVMLADRTGTVLPSGNWAWPQTGSPMDPFKRHVEWIMLAFSAVFLLVVADRRRLLSWHNADALVLTAGIGVAFALFDRNLPLWAIPASIPPLLYLLARALAIGFGSAERPRWEPPSLQGLAGLLVSVMAVRIGFNLLEGPVNDVGYASLFGADGIINHFPLYADDGNHLDTYGPVAYLAYVPASLFFPMHDWLRDGLPAAHATAVAVDLITVGLLVRLGSRIRPGRDGLRLGLALALAFAACPWTFFSMMLSTNDGLVSLLLVTTLLVINSPARRGVALGLAAATKFSPAALLPLIATSAAPGRRGNAALRTVLAFATTVVLAFLILMPAGGPATIWHETIAFQMQRRSFLSVWGQYPELHVLQVAVKAATLALIVGLAVIPRKRDLAQVCALAAGIIIALQVGLEFWTFVYVGWFAPLFAVYLLAAGDRVPIATNERVSAALPAAAASTP